MSYETLRYEIHDGVLVLTLARVATANAVNSVMARELPEAWARFEADPQARVAVVTAEGSRHFCSGADLLDPPETDFPGKAATLRSIRWTAMQNNVSKPVIAAVNGVVVGGGLHFVADADIVIAAETSYFSDPHVAVGYVSALEPILLARRMPIGAVMRLVLTGGLEKFDAETAHRLGLVDILTPPEALLERALELAGKISRHSPAAVARSRAAIWGAKQHGLDEALELGWQEIMAHKGHPDEVEGPRAFAERRVPVWQNPGQTS